MSQETAVFHKFCSRSKNIKTHMTNGKALEFRGGQFFTKVQAEIDFLNAEIEAGHPEFYIDKAERTVDSDMSDPLAAIKKRAVEEYIASLREKDVPSRDMGKSIQSDQIASTRDLAAITAGPKTSK